MVDAPLDYGSPNGFLINNLLSLSICALPSSLSKLQTSCQSYKASTIVIYDTPYYDLES